MKISNKIKVILIIIIIIIILSLLRVSQRQNIININNRIELKTKCLTVAFFYYYNLLHVKYLALVTVVFDSINFTWVYILYYNNIQCSR